MIIMDQSYQVAPGLKRKSKGSTAWLTQRGTPLSVAFDKRFKWNNGIKKKNP